MEDLGENSQLGVLDTQPVDSQWTGDVMLYAAAALSGTPSHIQAFPQTADVVVALLDLAKLAGRIACELNEEHGAVPVQGFERAYKDMYSRVHAVDVAFGHGIGTPKRSTTTSNASASPSPSPEPARKLPEQIHSDPLMFSLVGGIPPSLLESLHERLLESLHAPLLASLLASLRDDLVDPVALAMMKPVGDRVCNAALDQLGDASLAKLARAAHSRRYSAPQATTSASASGPAPRGAAPISPGDDLYILPSGFKRARVEKYTPGDWNVPDAGERADEAAAKSAGRQKK